MYKLSKVPLIQSSAIDARLNALAKEILASGQFDVLLGVLTGSFVFIADLVRKMSPIACDLRIQFVRASSYGDSTVHGGLFIEGLENMDFTGERILLVDDILDTGNTLYNLQNLLKERGAKDVKTCVLLDKPSRREVSIKADFTGFEIEDKFVVGYGLDFDGNYRAFSDIYTLEEI